MLGPHPPQRQGSCPHNFHNYGETIAAATTQMMWTVALATTRASFASTAHGLALWSRMLRAPIHAWSLLARPLAQGAATASHASTQEAAAADTAAAATDSPGEAAAFASYRSSGGHAAVQVITHH